MLEKFVGRCIAQRRWVVAVVGTLTLLMLYFALQVRVGTHFEDLLPARHPYVAVHDQFKSTFGGSNVVTLVLELDDTHPARDIFDADVLARLRTLTLELRKVQGVNDEQVVSLAARKLKDVIATSDGIEFRPLMFPDVPQDAAGLDALRERVLGNRLVLGSYVSTDLRAAVVTVDFYDHLLDAPAAFAQIRAIVDQVKAPGLSIRMVGEPILVGWVAYYLPETLAIAVGTLLVLGAILLLLTRSWRGTLLPGLAGVMSGIWALGVAALAGIQFDPLVVVVAFLITARAISHSVQLVTRFDDEIAEGAPDAPAAARAAMLGLFKPGMLGVIADAGCVLIVILMPIPLMQKLAVIGTVWVITITLSAVVMTPVLLSWVRLPLRYAHPLDCGPALERALLALARVVGGRGRYVVAGGAAVLLLASGTYAFKLRIGDANPGSPILHRDSAYNRDAAAIAARFPGVDRMFVVLSGDAADDIKKPAALAAMGSLQRYMEAQPGIGASLSIADVIPTVKRVMRDGNHRYEEPGRSQTENGELLYLLGSGADQSDMDRFADPDYRHGSVTLYFRDHQGATIREAVARLQAFIAGNPPDGMQWQLAGGLVGMLAAVNEVILGHQIESIALGMLVVVLCCVVTYRSLNAGMFFMTPVILSNTLTFSFMAWQGIGMNINTLPVAALGIGLGIDYAFYIVDGIRDEMRHGRRLEEAVRLALAGPGKGVVVTAGGLIVAVALWSVSSLRFQADMALLMAVWLCISALSALVLMPALVLILKPAFVTGGVRNADGAAAPSLSRAAA